MSFPIVVMVNSLTEFVDEVGPPPGVVRVNLTERRTGGSPLPGLTVNFDVQSACRGSQFVWFHYDLTLHLSPGGGKFFDPRDTNRYDQISVMRDLVVERLVAEGYTVRRGCFGLPESIKPFTGHVDWVRFVSDGDNGLRAVPAEEEVAQDAP